MKRETRRILNARGQAITEAVLILVIFLGFTFAVASYFKDQEVLKRLITGPFTQLAGLLQNGVWAPAETGAALHPTAHGRHMVVVGEGVR